MVKVSQTSAADTDSEVVAIEEAEADFILAVQSAIQKLLNNKGLRARDLSKRLQVTEARISQMFGDQAKNLTLRTIARVFYHLDETPLICTIREFEDAIGEKEGKSNVEYQQWTVNGIVDDLQVAPNIVVGEPAVNLESVVSGDFLNRWARAEAAEADRPRRVAIAR
ncbi:MAG: helix-turn-helix transcriptional regulator [Blastomonas fulva]|nr:helix-turn-helix transcriptional regulator [Blastomonas fulva]